MQHCPTCNAVMKESPICRRCKTDLTKALDAADRAAKHFEMAVRAYSDNRWQTMRHHARRAFSLHRTPQTHRLLACAALMSGDYSLAITTWAAQAAGQVRRN